MRDAVELLRGGQVTSERFFDNDARMLGQVRGSESHVVIFDALMSGENLWMSRARTPPTLFAAMDAPTPLPHSATPRSTSPAATALAIGMMKSG